MSEERWLKEAKTAVAADASVAIAMCQDTAQKEAVELYWVIDQFRKEFDRCAKEALEG